MLQPENAAIAASQIKIKCIFFATETKNALVSHIRTQRTGKQGVHKIIENTVLASDAFTRNTLRAKQFGPEL